MSIPKRKNNIKVYGVNIDTDGPAVTGRRKELLERITKSDSFLPDSILHDDLDLGMLDFVKENFKVISDGNQIPIIPKILTIQRWGEFTNNWTFSDEDGNMKLPFVAVVRKPDAQPGSNPAIQRTIPDRRDFFYASVPTWDGNKMGADVYKIPQPVAIDLTFDVTIVCTKFRDVNRFNKIVLQKFASRQAYTSVKGHYIPIVLDRIEDSTPMDTLDGRRFYIQNYTFTLLGFLIDDEEFEVKPAISRILKVAETDVTTKKKSPILVENEITIQSLYGPGSIVANYSATTTFAADRFVEVSFVDQLGTLSGDTIDIPVKLFIEKNSRTGSTTTTLSDEYSELNKTNQFSGLTITTSKKSKYEYIPITTSEFLPEVSPTPTPTSQKPLCDITYELIPVCDVTYELVPLDVTPTPTSIIPFDILVGGNYNIYSGVSSQCFIVLNSNGSINKSLNFNDGFGNVVFNTVQQIDNKIIAVGNFTSFSGVTTNRIVRLNSDLTRDNTFSIGTGFNGLVHSIQLQSDEKIIVGGTFTSYSGVTSNRIIRLNTDGSIDNTFNIGTGFGGTVYVTKIQSDGKIIVGGSFALYSGVTSNRIIRLNTDGSIDNTFSVGTGFGDVSPWTYSFDVQSDGKIIVGGDFTSYSGVSLNRIVRLNTDGSIDNTFSIGTGFDNLVYVTKIQSDGKTLVGGNFTSYSGVTSNRIIRLNTDGSIDNTFNIGTGVDDSIYDIVIQSDGKIMLGGEFISYNGTTSNYIIRLNTNGSIDNTFSIGTGFNGTVREINLIREI